MKMSDETLEKFAVTIAIILLLIVTLILYGAYLYLLVIGSPLVM